MTTMDFRGFCGVKVGRAAAVGANVEVKVGAKVGDKMVGEAVLVDVDGKAVPPVVQEFRIRQKNRRRAADRGFKITLQRKPAPGGRG
jgi:hypothetical protein